MSITMEDVSTSIPTSTQIGAIGECLVAAGILEASGGRLSPFKPIADDDGMDLLLFDKLTRRAIPLQIKCRRGYDDPKAQTVQFDVRLKTYAAEGEGYLLCVKLNGAIIETLWLIPARDLPTVARQTSTHLVLVPSAKPTSNDRFTPYRLGGLEGYRGVWQGYQPVSSVSRRPKYSSLQATQNSLQSAENSLLLRKNSLL